MLILVFQGKPDRGVRQGPPASNWSSSRSSASLMKLGQYLGTRGVLALLLHELGRQVYMDTLSKSIVVPYACIYIYVHL